MKWRRGVFRLYLLFVWIPWAIAVTYVANNQFRSTTSADWRSHFDDLREDDDLQRRVDSSYFAEEMRFARFERRKPDSSRVEWHTMRDSAQLVGEAKKLAAKGRLQNVEVFIAWVLLALMAPVLPLLALMWALSGFSSGDKKKT